MAETLDIDDILNVPWTIEVISPPTVPKVRATIQTDLWNLTTESLSDSTSLSVYENSLIILLCTAFYPVKWFSANNKTYLNQTWKNNQIWKDDSYFRTLDSIEGTPNTDYLINASKMALEYEASMEFKNVTPTTAGYYFCGGSHNRLRTNLTLAVDHLPFPTDSNYSEFLQTGFDIIRPPLMSPYSGGKMASATFIYTLPKGVNINQLVMAPDGITYATFTSETEADTLNLKYHSRDVSIDTINLFNGLGQTIVTSALPGIYYVIIETESKNGTVTKRIKKFTIEAPYFGSVIEVENLSPNINYVSFLTGRFYEINMYLQSTTKESIAIISGDELVPDDENCSSSIGDENRLPSEVADRCGILGLSQVDDGRTINIKILINATRPCILETIMPRYLQFVQFYSSTLLLSTADNKVFEDMLELEIKTAPVDVGVKVRDGVPITMFANDNLTVKCIMPACIVGDVIWCSTENIAGGCYTFPPDLDEYTNTIADITVIVTDEIPGSNTTDTDGAIPNDPSITFSSHYVGNNKKTYDLTFVSLKLNHSGSYRCALFDIFSRSNRIQVSAAFILSVEDPLEPAFIDNEKFITVQQTLKRNNKLSLSCLPHGRPAPDINWSWKKESSNKQMAPQFTDLIRNATLEIYEPGVYYCNATNRFGVNGRIFVVSYESSYLPVAIGIPIAVVLLLLAGLLIWWLRQRAVNAIFNNLANELKNPSASTSLDETYPLNNQANYLSYKRNFEINYNLVTVTKERLGEGQFGEVFKGTLFERDVAVKMPKSSTNPHDYVALADELKVMCYIDPHVNVLTLIGACTDNVKKKKMFILTEFCEHGSLKDYLQKNYIKFEGFKVNAFGQWVGLPGAVEQLLNYTYQAAQGMEHLAAANIIHRDLALRNLLLTKNQIVKISDFGMSRQRASDYYRNKMSTDVPIPMFWMAIESLLDNQYSQKSDVWSFGILMWEMFSCGRKRLYPDHDPDGDFRQWLRQNEGNRLGPPAIGCDEIYELMKTCWKENPDGRPSFSECRSSLSRILQKKSPKLHKEMLLSLSTAWIDMWTYRSVEDQSSERVPIDICESECSEPGTSASALASTTEMSDFGKTINQLAIASLAHFNRKPDDETKDDFQKGIESNIELPVLMKTSSITKPQFGYVENEINFG